ncbi:FG-GAP repeat protein, partial [Candidatus Sumerlaeota bacterium]|nr:FG-GAP repeat protein [Candidatus Sumerlaeota bacterium]
MRRSILRCEHLASHVADPHSDLARDAECHRSVGARFRAPVPGASNLWLFRILCRGGARSRWIWDLVVGADEEQDSGRVHLFSGATGQWLRSVHSSPEEEIGYFGYSIIGSEDLDGDGFGDVIVGALLEDPGDSPSNAGRVHIFSGATGALIRAIPSPNETTDGQFGRCVLSTPDFNGDEIADVLVSSRNAYVEGVIHRGGWVHLLSGAT